MKNMTKSIKMHMCIILSISSILFSQLTGIVKTAQAVQQKYNVIQTFSGNDDAYGRYRGAQFSDVKNSTKSITKLAALNVTNGANTIYYPGKYETKEQAIASLLKLKGVIVSTSTTNSSSSSKFTCSAWASPYINAAINAGIVPKALISGVNFTRPATREEVAYWISQAAGITPSKGNLISNMITDATRINDTYRPYIESLLVQGIMWNTKQKTFNPSGVMTRSDFASLLDTVFSHYTKNFGYKMLNGQILDIVTSNYTKGYLINKTVEYFIKLDDGSIDDLKVETMSNKVTKDFLVYKNNKLSFSGALKIGDYAYCITKDSKIMFIDVLSDKVYDNSIDGTIVSKDNNSLMIQTGNGQYQSFDITQYTTVSISKENASLSDLMAGQDVTVNYYGNYARDIDVYVRATPGNTNNPGNGSNSAVLGSNSITGTVEDLSKSSITVDVDGTKKTYQVSPDDTNVMCEGTKYNLYDIKPGDILKLTVDASNTVSSISIQAFGGDVKQVIKGQLLGYNDLTNSYSLKDVYELKNGKWQYAYPQVVYNSADDAQIYDGGKNLISSDIKDEIGQNLYAAVISDNGENVIKKVNFKVGSEMAVNDKLTDVNSSLQRIKIGSGSNINLDNGTIIVYNGKLASTDLLSKNDYLFAAIGKNPTTNSNYANMVYVNMPGFNNFMEHYKLYMGRLSNFTQSTIYMDTVSQFKNNKWVSMTANIPSIITNTDAKIFDSVSNNFIDLTTLMSGNYILDPTNNPWNNQSYYAYVITDENNVLQGLYLMNGAPNVAFQKLRYGTISDLKDDPQLGKVMTVANNLQWSDISSSWNSLYNNINLVNISNSLVFKDGQLTDTSSLSVDDNVLFMTDANGNRTCIFVR